MVIISSAAATKTINQNVRGCMEEVIRVQDNLLAVTMHDNKLEQWAAAIKGNDSRNRCKLEIQAKYSSVTKFFSE